MYSKIVRILDDYFYNKWFLDSGSLLGVVREGKFLDSDVGIDISVLVANYHDASIEKCVKEISKEGFVVSRFQIFGNTYKYCFYPKKGNNVPYAFDLHLFKLVDDNYLCPNMKMKDVKKNKITFLMRYLRAAGTIRHYDSGLLGFFEKSFVYLYRDVFEYFGKPLNFDKGVKDEHIYKWVIPQKMIHGVTRRNQYGLNELVDCDDYLTYRYGNWHIPVSDWVTIRDDGGFKKSTVKEVRDLLSI